MTGFGLGEAQLRSGRLTAEVRSLNHRFLDLRVRLPVEIAEHTFFVEQLCRERLSRGRFDVSVRVEGSALPPLSLDLDRAREAYAALARVRDELAPGTELPITVLTNLPGLIVSSGGADPTPLRNALGASLSAALDNLDEMRATEGTALAQELGSRLDEARRLLSCVSGHGPALAEAQHQRLVQRIERLMRGAEALDSTRMATEVALLADRSDITEEIVRLGSHFDQFQALLGTSVPTGRKLDFLLQEMGRETNTIGAKCQDVELSALVLSLKAEVERLREQVQNVE